MFGSGVLVAQCAEGPAGLVGREPLVPEVEDGAPVLEDAADEAEAHVPVLVQPKLKNHELGCSRRSARERGRTFEA